VSATRSLSLAGVASNALGSGDGRPPKRDDLRNEPGGSARCRSRSRSRGRTRSPNRRSDRPERPLAAARESVMSSREPSLPRPMRSPPRPPSPPASKTTSPRRKVLLCRTRRQRRMSGWRGREWSR
jgi:hypothetical protein